MRHAFRILLYTLILAFSALGCGLFTPTCQELDIYPSCKYVGDVWSCGSGGNQICNDDGLKLHYNCQDYGGTFCYMD